MRIRAVAVQCSALDLKNVFCKILTGHVPAAHERRGGVVGTVRNLGVDPHHDRSQEHPVRQQQHDRAPDALGVDPAQGVEAVCEEHRDHSRKLGIKEYFVARKRRELCAENRRRHELMRGGGQVLAQEAVNVFRFLPPVWAKVADETERQGGDEDPLVGPVEEGEHQGPGKVRFLGNYETKRYCALGNAKTNTVCDRWTRMVKTSNTGITYPGSEVEEPPPGGSQCY